MSSSINGVTGNGTLYMQNPVLARAVIERSMGNAGFARAAEVALAQMAGVKLEHESGHSLPPSAPQLKQPAKALGTANLTLLMAEMQELMSDATNTSLENKLKLFLAKQEGLKTHILEEAKKQEEAAARAEQAQKTMGCIGKIIGALVAVVAVVGAVFTGGASLVLAGVGLALFVADEAVKAATGKSFMAEAMAPIMDKVFKPMVEAISKAISGVLKDLGVDEKTAELVGSIVGAVVAVVAVVAVAIGLKKVVPTQAITKSLGKLASKIVPNFLKKVGAGLSGAQRNATNHVQNLFGGAEKSKLYANGLQRTALGASVGNAGVQAAGDIYTGVQLKAMKESEANVQQALATHKALEKLIEEASEVFTRQTQMLSQSMRRIFDAAGQDLELGKNLLANSRRAFA